jgi:hypothetical protein
MFVCVHDVNYLIKGQREASKICKITYFTILLLYDIFLTGVSDYSQEKLQNDDYLQYIRSTSFIFKNFYPIISMFWLIKV